MSFFNINVLLQLKKIFITKEIFVCNLMLKIIELKIVFLHYFDKKSSALKDWSRCRCQKKFKRAKGSGFLTLFYVALL